MSKSYWLICYTGPDGEEICSELFAELPPQLDADLRTELQTLGRVEEVTSQVADAELRVRLVEALDSTAFRLGTYLPEGTFLRMTDGAEVVSEDEFIGVPLVVGLTHVDAFNTLRAAGYGVKTIWEWTSDADENTVSGQKPPPGAGNLPPTVVNIWVRTLPPDPPPDDTPPVIISE